MKHARTMLTWVLAAGFSAGTTPWVQTAPVFNSKIELPDGMISLARISKLRIDMKDTPWRLCRAILERTRRFAETPIRPAPRTPSPMFSAVMSSS